MYAYDCAWNEKNDRIYLKRMYFLTRLEPELTMKERYSEVLNKEETKQWDEELEAIRKEAEEASAVTRIRQIFEKDPIKRLAEAGELVNNWKYQYRKMI